MRRKVWVLGVGLGTPLLVAVTYYSVRDPSDSPAIQVQVEGRSGDARPFVGRRPPAARQPALDADRHAYAARRAALDTDRHAGRSATGTTGARNEQQYSVSADTVKNAAAAAGELSPAVDQRIDRVFKLAHELQLAIDNIVDPEEQEARQRSLLRQIDVRLRVALKDPAQLENARAVLAGLPRIERSSEGE